MSGRSRFGGRLKKSLETRLVFSFLILSFAALGVSGWTAYRTARATLMDQTLSTLSATAGIKVRELDRWIGAQSERIRMITSVPGLAEASRDSAAFSRLVRSRAWRGRDLSEVFLLSPRGGRVIASSDPSRVGDYHVSDLFYLNGRSGPYVQNVYPSPTTGSPTVTVSAPIRDEAANMRGVLAAHLDLGTMDRIVNDGLGPHPTTEAYLVTSFAEFLSSEDFGRPDFLRGAHSIGIDQALEGRSSVGLYENYAGIPVLGAYRWMGEHEMALLVEVTQRAAFAPARALLQRLLISGGAAILILLVGVKLIGRTVTKPILAVSEAAVMVADGNFSVVAPERGMDEVGTLARSFNAMTAQLGNVYGDLERQVAATTAAVSALEKSEDLLAAIVDNSNTLIAVLDRNGEVRLANQAMAGLLSITSPEALGRPFAELVPEPEPGMWSKAIQCIVEGQRQLGIDFEWGDADARTSYHSVWFPLAADDSKSDIGVICTDLSERKRAEMERLGLEAQLQHGQKLESLGLLAGGIAHDFNNLLAAILGYAELGIASPAEEIPEHLDQIVLAANRAAELTNQMLAYAGRATTRLEVVDLNDAITRMSELVSVSLPKKVRFEVVLSDAALPVMADPAQVSQVLMNLMTNAGQAIGDNAGRVIVQTERTDSDHVCLTVRDDGCGMDPETLDKIFDPFFTTKPSGRGLGLAAVLGIARRLDGDIAVDSRVGRGTTFRVTLPLANQPSTVLTPPNEVPIAPDHLGKILIVDDEDGVRGVTRKVLERRGFEVVDADNGTDGTALHRQLKDELQAIVLDMSMPGMNGAEVYRAVRSIDEDIPVVFTSGYDPEDAFRTMQSDRGVRFVQKPFRSSTLLLALGELLEASEEYQEMT
jgi:PAS domain S-box-containing protein